MGEWLSLTSPQLLGAYWAQALGVWAVTHPHQTQQCLYVPVMLCCLHPVSSVHLLSAHKGFLVLCSHMYVGEASTDGQGRVGHR